MFMYGQMTYFEVGIVEGHIQLVHATQNLRHGLHSVIVAHCLLLLHLIYNSNVFALIWYKMAGRKGD